MNQAKLAKCLGCTPEHFNAVVMGREDAGKKLAKAASSMIGGTIDLWLFKENRPKRKEAVDRYLMAFKKALRVARSCNPN